MNQKRKPSPEREYVTREFESLQAFDDGCNALEGEGYELRGWRFAPNGAARSVVASFSRKKQTVLIVKTTP